MSNLGLKVVFHLSDIITRGHACSSLNNVNANDPLKLKTIKTQCLLYNEAVIVTALFTVQDVHFKIMVKHVHYNDIYVMNTHCTVAVKPLFEIREQTF